MCAIALALCLLPRMPSAVADAKPWWLADGELSAGPRCLAFASRYLGLDQTYGEVARAFPNAQGEASLADIAAAARKIGLYPIHYTGEPAPLGFSPYPVILKCRYGEVAVYRVIYGRSSDDKKLKAFEAPARLRELDHRYFGHSYRGEALIIADRPVADVAALLVPRVKLWRRPSVWAAASVAGLALIGGSFLVWRRR